MLYGLENFGFNQAEKYQKQLKQRLITLSNKPLFYPSVEHIRKDYRRSVCGAHSIYYRLSGSTVEIMRILGRQNIQTSF